MNKLLVTIAAAALVAAPLAAHAQDRDGHHGDWRDGHARSATAHGYDARARVYDHRETGRRVAGFDRGRYDARGFYGDRGFERRGDDRRVRGALSLGFGYGGFYPYAGGYYGGGYDDGGGYAYDDGYPAGGYGAGYAYSYPDGYGTYQPFAYDYSAPDDTYYADGPAYGGGGDYRYESDGGGRYDDAPNAGWSEGGPPVDCGQWIWREGRGAYEWVARPC